MRRPARQLLGLALRGREVECPCCGRGYRRFARQNTCWNCLSVARHRQVALLLRSRPDMLGAGAAILHIAPEPSIRQLLPPDEYVAGDLEPDGRTQRVDLTDIGFPDESFDAVIANHVMEHIPDDRRALAEIRRVLRPGGWAILMTPILRDVTDEDPSASPEERLRRFGQIDHVRLYGWDYVDRLEAAGLDVQVIRDEHGAGAIRRYALHNRQGFVEPLFLATVRPRG